MDASQKARTFASTANSLEDWFWEHGYQRKGRIRPPCGAWVRVLRDIREGLEEFGPSIAQGRAAVAVWGPSQTGKSTSVASYIDANALYTGNEDEDGNVYDYLQPGLILRLKPHESLESANPGRPNANAGPWIGLILRGIATGTGLSYETVARDYSQTTYSANRASRSNPRRQQNAARAVASARGQGDATRCTTRRNAR